MPSTRESIFIKTSNFRIITKRSNSETTISTNDCGYSMKRRRRATFHPKIPEHRDEYVRHKLWQTTFPDVTTDFDSDDDKSIAVILSSTMPTSLLNRLFPVLSMTSPPLRITSNIATFPSQRYVSDITPSFTMNTI